MIECTFVCEIFGCPHPHVKRRMMMHAKNWKAVEMGSEGWAVFGDHPKLRGGLLLTSGLTEEEARLIAAAPELLETASAWVDCAVYDEDTHTWTVFEKNDEYHDLCSAINKAKSQHGTLKGE